MTVHIALRYSREDSAWQTTASVRRDSIAFAQRATSSTVAGSHRKRAARSGMERIRIVAAYLAQEMMEAEAADAAELAVAEEEAIHTCIWKKRQWRNTRALACEQDRAIREMAGLPPKEEKEASSNEDTTGSEQIWLDAYCVFYRYFHDKDGMGAGKDKGNRG
ncbi:hypothetical protein D1007_40829 [Hordeum vulgare]|nr:hypothetical protein D1007_40829 [Hordeum vulgare]